MLKSSLSTSNLLIYLKMGGFLINFDPKFRFGHTVRSFVLATPCFFFYFKTIIVCENGTNTCLRIEEHCYSVAVF